MSVRAILKNLDNNVRKDTKDPTIQPIFKYHRPWFIVRELIALHQEFFSKICTEAFTFAEENNNNNIPAPSHKPTN